MRAGDVEQRAETIDFFLERLATAPGEAVVLAPHISVPRGRRRLLDPARFHQPLQRAVDRAGTEAKPARRLPLDFLEDRVAVALAAGKGEQDVDDRRA